MVQPAQRPIRQTARRKWWTLLLFAIMVLHQVINAVFNLFATAPASERSTRNELCILSSEAELHSRNQSLTSLKNSSAAPDIVPTTTHKDELLVLWNQLERYYASAEVDPPPKSVANFLPRKNPIESDDVVIATHVSANSPHKFENLKTSIDHWGGPISVAVYIQSRADIDVLDTFIKEADFLGNTSVHLVLEKFSNPKDTLTWTYPHNTLRNLALDNLGESDYFLALDVDLVPNRGSYSGVRSLLQSNSSTVREELQNRTLFVLPAFEVCPKGKRVEEADGGSFVQFTGFAKADLLPHSKADLVKLTEDGEAWVFWKDWIPGQGPTNFQKWYKYNESAHYYVQYGDHYEPYVMGYRPGIPRYWPTFRGFGRDKESWFFELHKAGYSYAVFRDYYLVHLCHPRETNILDTSQWPNEPRYEAFLEYLNQRYPHSKSTTL